MKPKNAYHDEKVPIQTRMAYFSLPDRINDQMDLILALSKVVFLKFDEKMELERILSSLEYHQTLTMREKAFLETMVKKYGIYA